ncbi:SDR family NAD(P)-dependent oxidoreductase [Ichthyenterobacterium sp. W332]|uniref:SDR family NAD(P)-dependent oxidoreductase n=1 Tax=Microcosmobacter mediterraneus TaxID=3075607 RepID=A0ABU2YG39_9FLAO|nr:SDR family NAD(P)-dependent oxidoreductase [Ichthyenterobacterium sp. W332]MDT0557149.1 SDR family NAD(P)-dependent oxidoreductase [Ichthyenterobacterium sp. W332]
MSKTILITGSTDGIGKLAAIKLAKEGHSIYLHGRNSEKLAKVISEVKDASNNSNIDGFVADFSDLKAVKNISKDVLNKLSSIDILINNAGIFKSPIDTTNDGLDIRFAVNYFAPYILTNALLSLLEAGHDKKIINLSSAAQATVRIGALNGEASVNVSEAYAQSKLALTMWSFYLAEQFKDMSIIAVNPGSLLNTRMANEAYGQHWSPASKGSDILYDLAISDEYKDITGAYFDNDKGNPKGTFSKAHPDAYNETLISELIANTKAILNTK